MKKTVRNENMKRSESKVSQKDKSSKQQIFKNEELFAANYTREKND